MATLPAHLGWESEAVTQLARAAVGRREQRQVSYRPKEESAATVTVQSRLSRHEGSDARAASDPRQQAKKQTITHYPSLGLAALRAGQAPLYQVWLAGRFLDEAGRGWLTLTDVRQQLAGEPGSTGVRLFGWRRLRQVLGQGDGRYWTWDRAHGRLWLFGAAQVAARLGVERLAGQPVILPVSVLTGNIGTFKAHLYAAWHSGRSRQNSRRHATATIQNRPVSRATQKQLTGVPPRTQRHYGRVAKVKRQPNIAIGGGYTSEAAEASAWQRGRGLFVFHDVSGRQGRPGGRYLAWHLPSTYLGPHPAQQHAGRQRKINRKLKDLVDNVAQGNSSKKAVDRRYLANGAAAAAAYQGNPSTDVYWQGRAAAGRATFWYVLPAATAAGSRK
jgi:hypothetical protein